MRGEHTGVEKEVIKWFSDGMVSGAGLSTWKGACTMGVYKGGKGEEGSN